MSLKTLIFVDLCRSQACGSTSKPLLSLMVPDRVLAFLVVADWSRNTPFLTLVVLLQVQALPINLSYSAAIMPVLEQLKPALPTNYALGSVLQVGPLAGLRAPHQPSQGPLESSANPPAQGMLNG